MVTDSALSRAILDRSSQTPLWQQLAAAIDSDIQSKLLRPDQALPSENELIDRLGVSRTVVREALANLVRSGRIYKIRARGSFVAPEQPELRFLGSTLGSSDDLLATGQAVTTRTLEQREGTATADEALSLRIPEGVAVVRLRRLRSVNEVPWLLVETTLPLSLFPGVAKANLENRSLYEHLRRHYGVRPSGADRWLSARLPTEEEAGLLRVASADPVLGIESVAWGDDKMPFEYYRAVHRSGSSRFYVGIR